MKDADILSRAAVLLRAATFHSDQNREDANDFARKLDALALRMEQTTYAPRTEQEIASHD